MPAPVTLTPLRLVHGRAFGLFDYLGDALRHGRPDHWQSHAAAVRAGRRFGGDCEDFAMTCAELLRDDHGVDPAALRLVYCLTARAGHMVLAVDGVIVGPASAEASAGQDGAATATMVLDNRRRGPVDWTGLDYRWISGMRLDEPGVWREIPT